MLGIHDTMETAGFVFDDEQKKYFFKKAPAWELERKKEKGIL